MIDWGRVHELQDEVGAEEFAEVVEIFLEEVEEVIGRLRKGTGTAALDEDMHFLKGSALNLGFSQMAGMCAEAERANVDNADVAGVIACFERSKTEFMARHLGTAEAA